MQRQPPPTFLPLQHYVRVELEGDELAAFQAEQAAARALREQREAELRAQREAEAAEVEIDIDSDEEDKIKTEELVRALDRPNRQEAAGGVLCGSVAAARDRDRQFHCVTGYFRCVRRRWRWP